MATRRGQRRAGRAGELGDGITWRLERGRARGAMVVLVERTLWFGARGVPEQLPKRLNLQTASFDDALERANWDGLVAMHRHDHLPPVCVPPLLMTPGLGNQGEAVSAQHLHNLLRIADWKSPAHGTASSSSFAPFVSLTGAGSNQSAKASLALATASSSVSPAEAQPGSSGKTADHRFAFGSNSTNNRSFTLAP